MTAYQASRAKQDSFNLRNAKAQDAAATAAANAKFAQENPQIGQLCRKGKTVYYVTTPMYMEHSDPRALVAG